MPISQAQRRTVIGRDRPRVSRVHALGRLERRRPACRPSSSRCCGVGVNWIRSSIVRPVEFPRASGQWLPQ